ncbi:MAG: hypothetical protein ACRET5_17295 [Steroidobacteraceae bacterium]
MGRRQIRSNRNGLFRGSLRGGSGRIPRADLPSSGTILAALTGSKVGIAAYRKHEIFWGAGDGLEDGVNLAE